MRSQDRSAGRWHEAIGEPWVRTQARSLLTVREELKGFAGRDLHHFSSQDLLALREMGVFSHSPATRLHVKFLVNLPDMGIDGRNADVEGVGDFLVEIASSQEFQAPLLGI